MSSSSRPRRTDRAAWVELGRDAIIELLHDEKACVRREIEARLSEYYFDPDPGQGQINIDPHILTAALSELLTEGHVLGTRAATRGGTSVTTFSLADAGRTKTVTANAAARKRMLYARFRGWSQVTTRYPRGHLGPAGEAAVRQALLDSHTITPFTQPDAGEVATLDKVRFNGPLDTGGRVISTDTAGNTVVVNVLIEVKNVRAWLYAPDAEVWQVLGKALIYQQARPRELVLPVLYCRRAHAQTRWLAERLGFLEVDMLAQFLGGGIPDPDINEVRNELAFQDLKPGTTPNRSMIDRFRTTLPKVAGEYALKWRDTALNPEFATHVKTLAQPGLTHEDRRSELDRLEKAAIAAGLRPWSL